LIDTIKLRHAISADSRATIGRAAKLAIAISASLYGGTHENRRAVWARDGFWPPGSEAVGIIGGQPGRPKKETKSFGQTAGADDGDDRRPKARSGNRGLGLNMFFKGAPGSGVSMLPQAGGAFIKKFFRREWETILDGGRDAGVPEYS